MWRDSRDISQKQIIPYVGDIPLEYYSTSHTHTHTHTHTQSSQHMDHTHSFTSLQRAFATPFMNCFSYFSALFFFVLGCVCVLVVTPNSEYRSYCKICSLRAKFTREEYESIIRIICKRNRHHHGHKVKNKKTGQVK